jgi:hypothetical protein
VLRWLATKGAKHLIVLSRSGATSVAAIQVVDELMAQCVAVSPPVCDCFSVELLSRVLDGYGRTMPPIRGCIIATMSLNVSIPFGYKSSRRGHF